MDEKGGGIWGVQYLGHGKQCGEYQCYMVESAARYTSDMGIELRVRIKLFARYIVLEYSGSYW